MSQAAIEVDHVWKRFRKGAEASLRDAIPAMARRIFCPRRNGEELREREFWALRDVSFQVGRGESLGIIGPNGAGKSTILKLLAGILRPNKGTLAINGRLSALIEVAAGFHPDLTGRENVYLNASILGMRRREVDRKYDDIVEFAGIREFMDTPVKRYSSGMYARLGFSVAAHMEPDILLVDEVLSVGDMNFRAKCFEKMKQFLENDITVIFVSHDLRAVAGLCERTLLMAGGMPLYLGETAEGIRRYFEAWSTQNLRDTPEKSKVFIESTDLVDENGETRGAYAASERASVRLILQFNEPVDGLAVGCFIRSEQQTVMMSTTSRMLGIEPFGAEAGDRLEVRFDLKLNLVPGTYHVGASVHDVSKREYYDHRDSIATFLVQSDNRAQGQAYLDPACDVRACPRGEEAVL